MPSPKKRASRPSGLSNPASQPWDPAGEPAPTGPSLEEEEQRQFHATHFTADPRGAAMSGSRPPGSAPRAKHRGGTPPPTPGKPEQRRRTKRRGGAGPADDGASVR